MGKTDRHNEEQKRTTKIKGKGVRLVFSFFNEVCPELCAILGAPNECFRSVLNYVLSFIDCQKSRSQTTDFTLKSEA